MRQIGQTIALVAAFLIAMPAGPSAAREGFMGDVILLGTLGFGDHLYQSLLERRECTTPLENTRIASASALVGGTAGALTGAPLGTGNGDRDSSTVASAGIGAIVGSHLVDTVTEAVTRNAGEAIVEGGRDHAQTFGYEACLILKATDVVAGPMLSEFERSASPAVG